MRIGTKNYLYTQYMEYLVVSECGNTLLYYECENMKQELTSVRIGSSINPKAIMVMGFNESTQVGVIFGDRIKFDTMAESQEITVFNKDKVAGWFTIGDSTKIEFSDNVELTIRE